MLPPTATRPGIRGAEMELGKSTSANTTSVVGETLTPNAGSRNTAIDISNLDSLVASL